MTPLCQGLELGVPYPESALALLRKIPRPITIHSFQPMKEISEAETAGGRTFARSKGSSAACA